MSKTQTTAKQKIKNYAKQRFSKQQLIQKGIIAGIAFLLVLALSLSFYLWLHNVSEGTKIGENGFIYLHIIWNDGIGFSALRGNTAAILAIQSIIFILLVVVFMLLCQDRITASFIALAMFGGLFNLIQRACVSDASVLDYFQFGFWKDFPVFNWPDVFVVIGVFGFVITYITLIIVHAVREEKQDSVENPVQNLDKTVVVEDKPAEKVNK